MAHETEWDSASQLQSWGHQDNVKDLDQARLSTRLTTAEAVKQAVTQVTAAPASSVAFTHDWLQCPDLPDSPASCITKGSSSSNGSCSLRGAGPSHMLCWWGWGSPEPLGWRLDGWLSCWNSYTGVGREDAADPGRKGAAPCLIFLWWRTLCHTYGKAWHDGQKLQTWLVTVSSAKVLQVSLSSLKTRLIDIGWRQWAELRGHGSNIKVAKELRQRGLKLQRAPAWLWSSRKGLQSWGRISCGPAHFFCFLVTLKSPWTHSKKLR